MKPLTLTLALFLGLALIPSEGKADLTMSIAKLKEHCSSDEPKDFYACAGYIHGVANGLRTGSTRTIQRFSKEANSSQEKLESMFKTSMQFCVPQEAELTDFLSEAAVIIEHAEMDESKPAVMLVWGVLHTLYPCEADKK